MKKEMLINVLQPEECRIAIVEDGVLEELYVERTSLESYTGNIYKGKIVNLEPAIQAGFVDFSVGRNGFLHVSDVEPQYYDKHAEPDRDAPPAREPRREREREPEDRRRGRAAGEEREFGAMPPAPPEDRPRGRDRERPERSEKGRRDRSQPRRFGEGLAEDDWSPPPPPREPEPIEPPPARATAPPERDRGWPEEARPSRAEPPAPAWADEPPPRARTPEPDERTPRRRTPRVDPFESEPPAVRVPRAADPDETFRSRVPRPVDPIEAELPPPRNRAPRAADPDDDRGRPARAADPFEADLPPSRTQRGRAPAPPRAIDPDVVDLLTPRAPREPERDPEPTAPAPPREPRRGRSRPAPEARYEPAFDEPAAPAPPEPDFDPPAEPESGRRRGREAIRSRGGEREVERPRSLPAVPAPPAEIEAPRVAPPAARAPERDRERERPRPAEVEPAAPAPPPTRERTRTHTRAGEPGYIPRRERTRPIEPDYAPASPAPASDWAEADVEPLGAASADLDFDAETDAEDRAGDDESGAAREGRRRRRRGRGRRRRDRDAPESAAGATADDLDFEDDADTDSDSDDLEPAAVVAPAPTPARRPERERPAPPARPQPEDDLDIVDDFDFGEDGPTDILVGDDEFVTDDPADARVGPDPDDTIDPELEEEIRREAEEIAELEREMGLRGPVEARPRRGDDRSGVRGRGGAKPPIQEVFRRGDEVLVQVIKESIGTKGPTLSTYISIPGRYLVLMPGLNRVGVSRKIADEGQRRKLRDLMNDLNPPKGLGFIVRTAGLDRTKGELARDLAYLLRLWKVILRRIKKAKSPALIYQESDMITRTIRDIFNAEIDTIWIDEPNAFERAQEFLRVVMPRFVNRLKLYNEKAPLFHKYGIEEEIAKIQRRHVPLPEGGSIVIDQTEALVAIDVNSGNFRVENDAERTAYEMNLRAAKEIARQLRLRDLGGVIVNDFIDMREERHRRGVERALRDAIKRDRARTKILRMSAFGLIEMTRQRIRPSLKRSVYEDCTHCAGAGVMKTVESMSIDVMRLLALASNREDVRRVHVCVASGVATYLNNRKRLEIARIEAEANMSIHVRHDDNVPAEHLQFECYDAGNNEVRVLPAPTPGPRRGR